MTALILHHYEGSPFSEKVRLVLGAKKLAWQSVTVPVMMPKPDVMALTGGYRRTPFLQIGADIYCDSTLMCRVIDAVAPQAPLYPAHLAGLAEIVAQWADTTLFWVAVPHTIQPVSIPHMFPDATPDFMQAFGTDRAVMNPHFVRPTVPDGAAQLATYLGRLENMLGVTGAFLLGDAACIADYSAAQSIWFMRRSPPVAAILQRFPAVLAWYDRVAAFGHGTPSSLTSQQAIEIAASEKHHAAISVDEGAGFAAGDVVTVMPTDYAQDKVGGHLVGLTQHTITIERTDPRAGKLHVHFPRIAFQVAKAR